jgi:hypothetical protein
MTLNITDPIGQAIERTTRMLFRGSSVGHWFVLGFSAWLAAIGSGGGGGNFLQLPLIFMDEGEGGAIEPWVRNNWSTLTLLGLIAITVGLAFYALLLWLRCRFQFIFLDNVVRNRTDIAENWANFKPHGNALFGFQLGLTAAFGVAGLLAGGLGVGLAWPDIQRSSFGVAAAAGIVIGGGLLVVIAITWAIAVHLLIDFVVPIMYRRGIGPIRAIGIFRADVLRGRVGWIALYLLLRWVLAMAAGMIVSTLVCATCCIGALPYLSSVMLLPVTVFFRTYPLYILGQLGPDFVTLETRTTPPPPPSNA